MAGYLNAEVLKQYAAIGAKLILTDQFLKEMNASFEQDPDGCFRVLVIEFLNQQYLDPLVEKHPEFGPIAETFQQERLEGSVHPTELCSKLFNNSVELAVREPYQYDVDFNVMMAAIMNNFFSDEVRQEFRGAFVGLFEQCETETYGIASSLFACALWGANYENFRKLTTDKYYELKEQGWAEEDSESGTDLDMEQPVISNSGHGEMEQKNRLIRAAEENVPDYSGKIRFLDEYTNDIASDGSFERLSNDLERGKKYAQIYMELEQYYMPPMYRFRFLSLCLSTLPELVTYPNGIVPADFFIDQFEKLIAEDQETAAGLAKIAAGHIEADLAFSEQMENMAAGRFEIQLYSWGKIAKYFMPKAVELGWDGYYADGSRSKWAQKPSSPPNHTNNNPPSNYTNSSHSYSSAPTKPSGCYVATAVYGSYDCPEVWTLRRFRDYSLAQSWYGRAFIKLYYAISPILVRWFGKTEWFKRFWKGRLDRLVSRLRAEGYDNTPYSD